MGIVRLKLLRTKIKPTINIASEIGNLTTLIDTGSHIPIWNRSLFSFKSAFPDAVDTNKVARIGGFGGTSVNVCDVWKVPKLTFTDEFDKGKKFIFHNTLTRLP